MPQDTNRYKADLREMQFLLFEQFKLGDVLGKEPFEAWGREDVELALKTAYEFVCATLGPLNTSADREGCRLENGRVITPRGFKEAWAKLYEAGWKSISVSPERGGQGAPTCVQAIVEELIVGANTAFAMYPGLAYGASEVIEHFGTQAQKDFYLDRMLNGAWGGTMCLTEPHAGSDVGASSSSARALGDGKYAIKGTKIFISAGDNDITDNIVHLVLARVDGAPPGTKGLSLFIVPKNKVDASGAVTGSNDVTVSSIEHKMGINGSATCVLAFGDNDECVGELVGGKENAGMSQMFLLMNAARISVGIQGVGVASFAYLSALDYAKERKQGASFENWKDPKAPRVAIIEHPDVRRMLLDMKARVEGIRALVLKLTRHRDEHKLLAGKDDTKAAYHQGQIDLLVPLVKSYGSDQAFRVCETAIQVYGGAGYTKDWPVEQACRDSKIFSIYEGTNHIQAMDLVGRKLPQGGGSNLQAFLTDVATFVTANSGHAALAGAVKELGRAQEALGGSAMRMLGWFQGGNAAMVPLAANKFLEMMSETTVAWLLLDGARIAHEALAKLPAGDAGDADRAFYQGKIAAAQFYARQVLPGVRMKAETLGLEDASPLEIPTAGFATC